MYDTATTDVCWPPDLRTDTSGLVAVFISSLFVKLLMDIYTGDRVKFAINVAQHLAV